MPAFVLASEQFMLLAKTLLKSRAKSDALAIPIPGNPAYASAEQLDELADTALNEMLSRLKAYPGG